MSDPWESKQILRDADGNPIPQRWDSDTGDFAEYTGRELPVGAATEVKQSEIKAVISAIKDAVEGTLSAQLTGSILADDGNGNPVPLTAIEDNGKYYLGVKSMDLVEEGESLG